jgi:GDPmannose 4,6-dehydratase
LKKAVIFGISGQDGFYLNILLKNEGLEVIGVSRSNKDWIIGDVSDAEFVNDLITSHQPDYIFHLAANSTTHHNAIFENHETIATGTLNILESVYRNSPTTKIFVAGSGLQFVNKGLPIKENQAFRAQNAYAIARIHSAYSIRYYRELGVKAYIGYLFNHDSSLRTEKHVNQKIVKALKRIAAGSNEKLNLIDVSTIKEFGFAGDIIEAIWILVNQDNIFEATIGTGQAYSIEYWLNICAKYLNLDLYNKLIISNNTPFGKALVSMPTTIKSLGWKPKIDIHKLAEMMILNER